MAVGVVLGVEGARRHIAEDRRPDPAARRRLNAEVGNEAEGKIEAEVDQDALDGRGVHHQYDEPEHAKADNLDGAEDEEGQRARLVIKVMRGMRESKEQGM